MSKEYHSEFKQIENCIQDILSAINDGSFVVVYGSFASENIDEKVEPSDVDMAVVTSNLGFGGSPLGNRMISGLNHLGRKIHPFPTIDLEDEKAVSELLDGKHVLIGKSFKVIRAK